MKAFKTYREQNPGKTYFDFKAYADGGEIPPSNKPVIPEEPQPYKGKLYKDRYGRKYTERMKKVLDQMSRTDSMKEVARASKQFGNINKYTKWFNSIPLLGVGAAAVYANDQE